MDYGTRWKHVRKAAWGGVGFTVVQLMMWTVGAVSEGWSAEYLMLLPLCFVLLVLFPLAFGFLALFRVRVKEGKVEHVFSTFVIRSYPLSQCVSADGQTVLADVKRWAMQP